MQDLNESELKVLERLMGSINGQGANIEIKDPRVSSVQSWLFGAIGVLTLGSITWMASSINRLNETMIRVATQNESMSQVLIDHSERLKDLERRSNVPR